MAKIIDLNDEFVTIGMDDGSILEVDYADVNFNPSIGDHVEIFRGDDRIIVTRNDGTIRKTFSHSHPVPGDVQAANYGGILVNKYIYGFTAIFLGSFGIHKFYAGRIGTGILMFLFSWSLIPGVIGLVQGVSALNQKADKDGNIIVM